MAKILIIDDEENIRSSLKSALTRRNYETVTAATLGEGEKYWSAGFDVIFLDIMLPDGNGIDLLKKIVSKNPNQPVVMISGHADIETAIEAIRIGAYDFIEKPLSLDRVLITIDNALKQSRLTSEKDRLTSKVYGDFIGQSPAIDKLKSDIEKSASKASQFLILGENGTGKELAAHMIHEKSRFPDGPFVAINCAALPSELVESELFGHVAGAFTGASKSRRGKFVEADGGSIFLDEISEMSADAQAKMLRVIETRQVTPVGSDKTIGFTGNIIAASNRNLIDMIELGKFREDLLYRLNVVQFTIPPLRERTDDIQLLADYFLNRFASESGAIAKHLTTDAISHLRNYSFPGNIRELKHLMERVNIYCETDKVMPDDLKPLMPRVTSKELLTLKDAVDDFEREYIQSTINANNGNMTETARQLGIERSLLYKKLKRLEK